MSVQIKQLGSGTISAGSTQNPAGTAVGANKTRIVKNIRLVNGAATASAYVTIYLNTGSDVLISPVNLILAAAAMYVDETEITMEAGHLIKIAIGGGGGPVHYTISGIERDV